MESGCETALTSSGHRFVAVAFQRLILYFLRYG